jgi:8-oxo-dGTP diphosphatase
MAPLPAIDVAVAIVRQDDGRVLVAERTKRQMGAGFWELPGGKIDPGETAVQAAARELHEEVGITAHGLRPWARYEHAFPTKRVRLNFFMAEGWSGAPQGREGQRVAWIDPAAPRVAPVLPSNTRVLTALGLSPFMVTFDCARLGGARGCLSHLEVALMGGARFVLLRADGLVPDQRVAFARRAVGLCHQAGARILLTGTALEANRAGAAGVYACNSTLRRTHTRPDVGVWAASCRDAGDVARAAVLGAELAVVSSVLKAKTAGRTTLGWEGLRAIAAGAALPLYACGGIAASDLRAALAAGCAGIAIDCADLPSTGLPATGGSILRPH